jgi:hypothetical protein
MQENKNKKEQEAAEEGAAAFLLVVFWNLCEYKTRRKQT